MIIYNFWGEHTYFWHTAGTPFATHFPCVPVAAAPAHFCQGPVWVVVGGVGPVHAAWRCSNVHQSQQNFAL